MRFDHWTLMLSGNLYVPINLVLLHVLDLAMDDAASQDVLVRRRLWRTWLKLCTFPTSNVCKIAAMYATYAKW